MRGKKTTPAHEHVELLVVRNGRHPIVLLVMAACLGSGLMGLFMPPDPSASIIDRYVPEPWKTTYYVILTLASIVILIGVWLPDPRDRLMVEQIGLWFLSGALLIYPIVIWTTYSQRLALGGMISLLCGIGGLARIAEILREVRAVRHLIKGRS